MDDSFAKTQVAGASAFKGDLPVFLSSALRVFKLLIPKATSRNTNSGKQFILICEHNACKEDQQMTRFAVSSQRVNTMCLLPHQPFP